MNQVDLCNLALDQISARSQITGISPASPPNNLAAQVASRTYQIQADAVFRAAHWNSARRQKELTLLKSAAGTPQNPDGTLPTPPVPFLYEYAWPTDCLKFRFLFPQPNLATAASPPIMTNTGVSSYPVVNTAMPYVVDIDDDAQGNQIKVLLTNACRATGVYTARINNVDLWDPALQNAVIGALASWFIGPLSGDDKKLMLHVQMAAALIQQARISDGNETIQSQDIEPDWMRIRDSGSGWGLGAISGLIGAGCVAGYDSWGAPNGMSY